MKMYKYTTSMNMCSCMFVYDLNVYSVCAHIYGFCYLQYMFIVHMNTVNDVSVYVCVEISCVY